MIKKGRKAAIVPQSIQWLTTAKYCGSKFGNELTGDHGTLPHRTNIGNRCLRPRYARPWQ